MTAAREPVPAGPAAFAAGHVPVMCAEVIDALAPREGGIYVDGTFGAGGYTRALLDAADCRVCAIDRDPDAIARSAALAERYGARLAVILGRFGEMDTLLAARGIDTVDGIAFDLGVSSHQLGEAARGFSFRLDGPLDMRMERSGQSAADVVNGADAEALAEILRDYGEERLARRIARAIVAARRERPITRTSELADLVRGVYPARAARADIDPATRTFQALRIYVNGELDELDRGLHAAETLLRPTGRLAVVTFHSLEDRRVKTFLAERSARAPGGSRHRPAAAQAAPTFRLPHRRAMRPSAAEVAANPRARSARLRIGERTAAPARPRGAA